MADNTVINSGSGGDTIRTDEIGAFKVPVSKIMVGIDGIDDGLVADALPLPSKSQGWAAHDAVDSGNPAKAGAYASLATALPTAVSAGDIVNVIADTTGRLFVKANGAVAHDTPINSSFHPVPIAGRAAVGAFTVDDGDVSYIWCDTNGRMYVRSDQDFKMVGNVVHDAVDSGAPVKVGGRASASAPTAVSTGDRVDAYFDTNGRLGVFLDGAASISVTSQPARAASTDSITAKLATDGVHNGLTLLPIKYRYVELAADGEIIAAVAGKKIRVLSMAVSADGDVGLEIKSGGSGGTVVTGWFTGGNTTTGTLGYAPTGHFENTNSNENLYLDQGSPARNVRITMSYVEV